MNPHFPKTNIIISISLIYRVAHKRLTHEKTAFVTASVQFSNDCFVGGRLGQQNTPTASLQMGKTPPNECPGYDTKQSDGVDQVMLELWGMRSTPLLPSLSGPL